jgi:hypothetical protein
MSEAIAAGWYPDPDDGGASDRYWDGRDWTEQTRPAEPDVPAGWYPDPDDGGLSQRYWDGTDWTERTRPANRPQPTPSAKTTATTVSTGPRFISPEHHSPAETTEGGLFGVPTAARIFTTAAVSLNLIFLIWVIASGGSGVALFLWAAVDVILGMLWFVARLTKSECPVCGSNVRRDADECRSCGYEFRSDAFPFADAQR